jgi:ribosomal subunit interface protein
MQVIVQGQHLDVGDALRSHVQEKLTDTCTRFFNHSIRGNVHFVREAVGFRTDITLTVGNGIVLKSTAEAIDPYPSFDQANDRLVKQLKKYKERLKDHHAEQGKSTMRAVAANEYTLPMDNDAVEHGEGGDAALTLAELPTKVPTLAVSDAVMRMDLADLNALLFRNASHGRLNMVYRRNDGNIGWVDPQENASTQKAAPKKKAVVKLPLKKAAKPVAKKPAKPKKSAKTPKKAAKKPAALKKRSGNANKMAKKPVKKPVKKAMKKAKRRS